MPQSTSSSLQDIWLSAPPPVACLAANCHCVLHYTIWNNWWESPYLRQAKDTYNVTWVLIVRATWRIHRHSTALPHSASGYNYDEQAYGGEISKKEKQNGLFAVERDSPEEAMMVRNGLMMTVSLLVGTRMESGPELLPSAMLMSDLCCH